LLTGLMRMRKNNASLKSRLHSIQCIARRTFKNVIVSYGERRCSSRTHTSGRWRSPPR
jgi:hypothetical protein